MARKRDPDAKVERIRKWWPVAALLLIGGVLGALGKVGDLAGSVWSLVRPSEPQIDKCHMPLAWDPFAGIEADTDLPALDCFRDAQTPIIHVRTPVCYFESTAWRQPPPQAQFGEALYAAFWNDPLNLQSPVTVFEYPEIDCALTVTFDEALFRGEHRLGSVDISSEEVDYCLMFEGFARVRKGSFEYEECIDEWVTLEAAEVPFEIEQQFR